MLKANVPIVSATQTTRSGYGSSDVDLTDTSESFGLPATADLMFALISTEDLESLGQIMVKQLKNRYNDPTIHKRFVVGIDRAKMRLYDCEQSHRMISLTIRKKKSIVMKNNQNQRNPSMDSNSDMGLTTRDLQSKLVAQEPPHMWEVKNS